MAFVSRVLLNSGSRLASSRSTSILSYCTSSKDVTTSKDTKYNLAPPEDRRCIDFLNKEVDFDKLAYEDPHYGKEFTKEYKMADALGESVGSVRYELLMKMAGNDDPFEMKAVPRRNNSRDNPNLVPANDYFRMMGCICNNEMSYVHYVKLFKDVLTRCKCGHYFKLVDYPTYNASEKKFYEKRREEIKDLPDYKKYQETLAKGNIEMDRLYAEFEKLPTDKSDEARILLDKMAEVRNGAKEMENYIKEKYFAR